MINNLNNLINQYGTPDALIDNWDEELIGYAVWGFEESIIWNNQGLYISNKKVKCVGNKTDKYSRLIAICYVRNKDINMWLVRNGFAVSYKRYSSKYLHQEKMAQKEKIGLWQGKFDMPWEWRKKNK